MSGAFLRVRERNPPKVKGRKRQPPALCVCLQVLGAALKQIPKKALTMAKRQLRLLIACPQQGE